MTKTISMDGAGRIVLPKLVRERYGLRGGSELELLVVGDRIELCPVVEDGEGVLEEEVDGLLVVPATGESFDAVEALAVSREERGNSVSKG